MRPQVVRLSSQDVPTAYAYELEAATIVQPEQVVEAVKKVVPSRQIQLMWRCSRAAGSWRSA